MTKMFSAGALLLLVAACDGDSAPFEDAVEVRDLNLTALLTNAPAISLGERVIAIDQSLQFSVDGRTAAGELVPLSASERQWAVSNASVATIDSNGLLTARGVGEVSVMLEIGGLAAENYVLDVSDATLQAVTQIAGDDTLERCLPGTYRATGTFTDTSVRDLGSVDWTLVNPAAGNARTVSNPDGSVQLTGLNPSVVQLVASVDGAASSLSREVEINDTLMALTISTGLTGLDVGDTLGFVATGTYADDADTTRQIANTEAVDWSIIQGTTFASVSNTAGSRGEVTGLAEGQATLSVRCGDIEDTQMFTVFDGDSSSDELSLSEDSLVLSLSSNVARQLSVSTGTEFDSSNNVSEQVTWSVSNSGILAIDQSNDDFALISAVAEGSTTLTASVSSFDSVSISVTVTDP